MKKEGNRLNRALAGANATAEGEIPDAPTVKSLVRHKVALTVLLVYIGVSFALVLISVNIHTLTQGGGVWTSYLIMPMVLGFAVLLFAGGFLLFRQGISSRIHQELAESSSAVSEKDFEDGKNVPTKPAVIVTMILSLALVVFGIFIFWTSIVNPLRDIPYISDPAVVSLSQVSFEQDNWSDSTSITLSGMTDMGDEVSFSIDQQTYQQGMALEYSEDQGQIRAEVAYLPYSGNVMSVEMWESQ